MKTGTPIEISNDSESEVGNVETSTAPPRKRTRLNKEGQAGPSRSKKVVEVEQREESDDEDRKWVRSRISLSPVRNTSKVVPNIDKSEDIKPNIKRLSLSPIRSVRLEADEEAMKQDMLKKIKNPNVKIKKGMELNQDTLWDRIKRMNCPMYDVPPPHAIRDIAVSRAFLSATYGGNTQNTFPSIGKKFVDRHGMDDFMCPVLDYNPQAPQVPGAPGLFFTPGYSRSLENTIHRLIVRHKPCSWLYMGQYKLTSSEPLTGTEWDAQSRLFHDTWAKWMIGTERSPAPHAIRIAARRRYNCQTPTDKQENAILQSGAYKDITTDDIKAAMSSGEEVITVWEMRCVGYDVAFQQSIAEKFPQWKPSPTKPRKTKKTAVKNKKQPTRQNNGKRKRRVAESSDSSDSPPEHSESDEGGDSDRRETCLIYHVRVLRTLISHFTALATFAIPT